MTSLIIHPHRITIDTYKCYTRKELWKKIKHNKSAKALRELVEEKREDNLSFGGFKISISYEDAKSIIKKHGGVIV